MNDETIRKKLLTVRGLATVIRDNSWTITRREVSRFEMLNRVIGDVDGLLDEMNHRRAVSRCFARARMHTRRGGDAEWRD